MAEEIKKDIISDAASTEHTLRGCLACLVVLVVFVLIATGIVIAIIRLGVFTKLKSAVTSVVHEKEQENAILQALRDFASAQTIHKAKYGVYAAHPEILNGMGKVTPKIATAVDPARQYNGYYFIGLEKQGPGTVNPKTGFAFVAIPAEYGQTGRFTYLIGPKNTVFRKDLGGKTIEEAPASVGSWEEVR